MTNNQHQENEAFHEHDVQKIQNLDFDFESIRASIQREKKFAQRDKKQRVLDSNHSSLFHRRFLRQRKMNQNLLFLKRNRFQVTKKI
jgi:hypothetical protein